MSFLSHLDWRYATRAFNQSKSLESEKLEEILRSIRMAPTSFGLQPYHITVIPQWELRTSLLPHLDRNPVQATTAPYLIVFSARTDLFSWREKVFDRMSGGNADMRSKLAWFESLVKKVTWALKLGLWGGGATSWSQRQLYIGLGFAMAACAELQVDSCAMEGFSVSGMRKALNLPCHIVPSCILAVGYRSEDDKQRPKFRMPMEDLVVRRD